MKSANWVHKLQFRCGSGRGYYCRLEFTVVNHMYFGEVEIIEFCHWEVHAKHMKNTFKIQNN